eukprot:GDKH01012985.1.p2 GENE.GDKH01012985.1~~GDKH01012985.1.p2  ORF type:complete len:166 (+),score=62.49 GDKH01012985.1:52-549(+)
MAPKFDPNEEKIVYIRQYGGEIGASSVLAPKVGPLGMSPKKIGEDIQKATLQYKGMRVKVRLTIKNRQAKVDIVPTATSMVIKELNEPERDRKKVKHIKHSGNLSIETIYKIARVLRERSMSREFWGTVKEVLGTANSVGCTVDGKAPTAVQEMIDDGSLVCPDE